MSAKRTSLEITEADIQRFWEKVDKSLGHGPNGTCWIWIAGKDKKQYGVFSIGRKTWKASRFSLSISRDRRDLPWFACHACDFPPCCNPDHLFWGTCKDNLEDAARKGRMATGDRHMSRTKPWTVQRGENSAYRKHPESFPKGDDHYSRTSPELLSRGEESPKAKLTDVEVLEIRRKYASKEGSMYQLAREYSVSRPNIGYIVRRESWTHLP